MGFVKYQKAKGRIKNPTNTIGISVEGRFSFYRPVVKKYFEGINYVELFHDPDGQKIGILPLVEPSKDSFRIQGRTTKMIVAKRFLKKFGIPVENKRYAFAEENGMLVIELQ